MSEKNLATEDYVDKAVPSDEEKQAWDSKYDKPDGGIPKIDLAADVRESLGRADSALQSSDVAEFIDGGEYDSDNKKILLKHGVTTIAEIDATKFIKDGMVSRVEISGGNLVISFNTDAGTEPISIALTNIFDPANYYDKEAANNKFVEKEPGKGLSANDFTTAEKTKLAGIANGANAYTLPTATANTLGGVKVGSGLSMDNQGNLSAGVTSVNGQTGDVDIPIPTVPTKVSDLTNDAGFLTEHQDISGKADASAVTTLANAVSNIQSALGNLPSPRYALRTGLMHTDPDGNQIDYIAGDFNVHSASSSITPSQEWVDDFWVFSGDFSDLMEINVHDSNVTLYYGQEAGGGTLVGTWSFNNSSYSTFEWADQATQDRYGNIEIVMTDVDEQPVSPENVVFHRTTTSAYHEIWPSDRTVNHLKLNDQSDMYSMPGYPSSLSIPEDPSSGFAGDPSVDHIRVTFPAKVSGKVRDFILFVEDHGCGGQDGMHTEFYLDLPSSSIITFHVKDGEDITEMTTIGMSKRFALNFTEIAEDVFLVSRIDMENVV